MRGFRAVPAVAVGWAIGSAIGSAVWLGSAAASSAPLTAAVAITGMAADGPEASNLANLVRTALEKRAGDVKLVPFEDEAYYFRSTRPKHNRSRSNLRAAQKYVKQAETSFQAFDLADAHKSVLKARSLLQDWQGLKEAADVCRQTLQLTIAIAHAQRDEKTMKDALAEYAVRFPNEPPPPGLWPPEVLSRLKAKAPPDSVLNVRSDPRGLVYVDGREVGTSPVRLGALPEGTHRIEVFLPNYFTFEESVDTAAGREALLEVKLSPDLSSKLKKLKLDRPFPEDVIDEIRALTQPLGLQMIAAAAIDKDGKLVLRRIDLGGGASSAAGLGEAIKGDNTAEGADLLASQLFTRAEPKGPAASRATVPLWAWMGGGAAVAAVGAGLVLRFMAVGTHSEFDQRQGALTQTQAFELRSRAESQANGGAALVGLGVAAILGITLWVAIDLIPPRQGS